ncbi:MAG: hypothetical protein QM730_19010 [Anaerolineales bacterium]
MTADKKSGFNWLILVSLFWGGIGIVCLGLGVFFLAFYDSPIDPQKGMGMLDYTLIGSVIAFPILSLIASLATFILSRVNKRIALTVALLPIIPLIPIIAIFSWSSSSKDNTGDATQLSECSAPIFDGGDGLTTSGCGLLQKGVQGSGDLSATTEAHNWRFSTEAGRVKITVKNDGNSCPYVMALDSKGEIVDAFEDENKLRLCPSGMITTGFFEFTAPETGIYTLRLFSPEAPGTYWVTIE